MMVSPISSVRFGSGAATIDLAREGAHTRPNAEAAAPAAAEKKSGTGKKVLKTVIGLAVVAAALAALPKVFKNAIKVLPTEELAEAGFMKKAAHYLAKTGEAIGKYTYEPIVKLFKKTPKAE